MDETLKDEVAAIEANAEVLTRVVMEAVRIARLMRDAVAPIEVNFGPLIHAVTEMEARAAFDVLKEFAEMKGSTIQ